MANVFVMPDASLDRTTRSEAKRDAIGTFRTTDNGIEFILTSPEAVFPTLVATAGAGGTRFVVIEGSPLERGQGFAIHYSLQATYADDLE